MLLQKNFEKCVNEYGIYMLTGLQLHIFLLICLCIADLLVTKSDEIEIAKFEK